MAACVEAVREVFGLPIFKQRIAIEIVRNIKAFLNLDAGITRGAMPDFVQTSDEQTRNQLQQARSQLKQKQERLSATNQRIKLMREQLATDGREIHRLQQLVHERSI